MRSRLVVIVLLVGCAGVALAQESAVSTPGRLIRVMTRNVYHGVDAEILAIPAASPGDLPNKVADVYNGYLARNFPERAAALALEIYLTRPDLIGLQEAILVRTQSPSDPATPATTVRLDYVQILLDALAARGLAYRVVTQSVGFDFELPSALGFDVRHTDREVILARADLKTAELALSNPLAGSFAVNCGIPTRFGPTIPIRRGWVSVDATVRDRRFRFISTHLDGDCLPVTSAIQQAQAAELLAGPGATDLPIVVVGDFNSPADGTGVTYNKLTAAPSGLADAWTLSGLASGLTCCQADDLRNVTSSLTTRIDFVLFRGPFTPVIAITVGDHALSKTRTGMWPSDHAGVVAGLLLEP
jgi:endonuclease/exonuclease/phosphatase family metal-dependent hydrolase